MVTGSNNDTMMHKIQELCATEDPLVPFDELPNGVHCLAHVLNCAVRAGLKMLKMAGLTRPRTAHN